ncbi:MAG: Fe2+-dependent dioxygenase [Rhodanobacter sp.]
MIICVPNVLTTEELNTMHRELQGVAFVDGATTAGYSAREVKKNLQISLDDKGDTKLQEIVRDAFLRNGRLQAALLPAVKSKTLFNRYDVGMEYGLHVDSPVMGGVGDVLRSDIAITVFLSDPKSYDGGELMMNMSGMEYGFKLEAGSAVAYPANTLHRVTPITRGARYAAVIWVQSQIRDADKRELLWDLNRAKGETFTREGKSETFDAISRSYANLLRMWAEV